MVSKIDTEEFIKRSIEIHGNVYDYSLSKYKNNDTKLKIICEEHGVFEQRPRTHVNGKAGCPGCRASKIGAAHRLSFDKVKRRLENSHEGFYDYSLVTSYKNQTEKLPIICNKHGVFMQSFVCHVYYNYKCPQCARELQTRGYENTHKETFLYLFSINGVEDEYLKVGLSIDPERRAYEVSTKTYSNVYVLKTLKGDSKTLCKLERKIHFDKSLKKHKPFLIFGGFEECYHIDELDYFYRMFNKLEENKIVLKYEPLKLKTPPPPEIAFLDLDSPLFSASSAGENVIYRAVDLDGNIVAEFPSAAEYKNWVEVSEAFGADIEHGYEGDFSQLTREVDYEILDVEKCYKAFDKIINDWVKQSGCKDWVGFISKNSGLSNFRYDICTLKGYKSGREGTRKPHHLEAVRKYAAKNPKIKIPRGPVEVDDVSCARANKVGWRGCVISQDKDCRGENNCHFFIPDEMDKPQFSSKKIVGNLYKNDAGKIVGYGWLFWIFQSIASDKADSIPGCKGIGDAGAFEMLSPFAGASIEHLPEVMGVACGAFKESFGESYKYKHCYTGELIEAHWSDLMEEMLHLVYMKKSLKDVCPLIEMIEDHK